MVEKSKVKYIQSLSHKKQRDEEGVFVAEGPRIINDLLQETTLQVQELFATKEWISAQTVPHDVTVHEVDEVMLGRLSMLSTPNHVVGLFRTPDAGEFVPGGQVSLMLETIQDPGNLGSIIRCADWFGIGQVVCSPDCADVYNPKAVQSTMGSVARVKVYYRHLAEVLQQHAAVPVFAATLDGTDIRKVNVSGEAIILIGNEARGLSNTLLELATQRITIAGKGRAESLNAAVATGIILSHFVK